MVEKVKVAVGVPYLRAFEGYFLDTMLALAKPPETQFYRVPDKPVDLARNILVEKALADPDCTHLLMVDSDMILPPLALFRLIQDDKDVVSGTYFARTTPPNPHLYEFHHEDAPEGDCPMGKEHHDGFGRWYRPMSREMAAYMKRHPDYGDYAETAVLPMTPDSLIPIEAAGAGILLIKRAVLEAMEYPYFKCHERSAGGEDFYFFEKARALGFETYGDLAVQCQHEFRGAFMDRMDFAEVFHVGQPDEQDFDRYDQIVDMSPQEPIEPHVPSRTSEAV